MGKIKLFLLIFKSCFRGGNYVAFPRKKKGIIVAWFVLFIAIVLKDQVCAHSGKLTVQRCSKLLSEVFFHKMVYFNVSHVTTKDQRFLSKYLKNGFYFESILNLSRSNHKCWHCQMSIIILVDILQARSFSIFVTCSSGRCSLGCNIFDLKCLL